VGALIIAVRSLAPLVTAALRSLTKPHPGWLVAAVAVEALSVLATAQQHRVLLGAAGAKRPGVGDYLAVTYVGSAVSSGLPGGPGLAIAYVYRQLRFRGVTESQAGWTLAASGAVSTAVLALVSIVAVTLAGRPTAPTLVLGVAEIAAVPALVGLVRWGAWHPQPVTTVASAVLGRLNRLRRRPVDTGLDRVVTAVATLSDIQPRSWHWLSASTLAAINWGADAACLALCLLAVGTPVPPLATIVTAYLAGVAATQLTPLPAGIGVTEAAITAVLVAHGTPAQPALAAVLLFRLASPGLNTAIGAVIALARPVRTRANATTHGGDRSQAALATMAGR
jgi:uncharacterized membrane protein YbhN (UPF0104 family)